MRIHSVCMSIPFLSHIVYVNPKHYTIICNFKPFQFYFSFRLKPNLSFENIFKSFSNFLSQKSIKESLFRQASDVSQSAPLVVRTSQSGIIPDTQNIIGLSELIPDSNEIDPTFQVNFSTTLLII